MHKTRLVALSFAAATTLISVSAGVASADPVNAKNSLPLTVSCDNGHTYSAVSNGNGHFTPAHDVNSTATLIPVAFGELTSTFTPTGGTTQTETQPPTSKGSSASNPNATTNCTFTGGATTPQGTFTLAGSVTGMVTK